jgi:ABC-2 type transport system ATP-binding protein
MGMKQRLGIASTLLRDPELIILDEPTNGLDPAGTKEIRDLIPCLAHESRAILLCSHLLHEVEMVCDHVAIIKEGTVIANAPVKQLLAQGNQVQIKTDKPDEAVAILSALPWAKDPHKDGDYVVVDVPAGSEGRVNQALGEKGIFASEVSVRSASLEQVFLQLTGGASGD